MSDAERRVLRIARARRLATSGEARQIRVSQGLSLRDLADAVGVAVTTLSRWERGDNVPRSTAAVRWVNLLDEMLIEDGPAVPARRLGRPPVYGPEHYAAVARTYLEAWETSDAPTKAVADAFGTSSSAAAKWVQHARSVGLLPETNPPKPRPCKHCGGTGVVIRTG